MLNFNSTQFQLLNFNYDSLLDNENALLTFDLLGLSKTVIPFFHKTCCNCKLCNSVGKVTIAPAGLLYT